MLTGCHMDSQPTGGRFDGIYGVLAAFEALEALEDAGIETRRPIDGGRLDQRGRLPLPAGRDGLGGVRRRATLDDDAGGEGLEGRRAARRAGRDAEAAPAPSATGTPGFAIDGYVEAHIEQGPRLENARQDDRRRHRRSRAAAASSSRSIGEEAHAGTTPRAARKDALRRRRAIVGAMYEATRDADDTLRFTIGRFEVSPGSPNTVPGKVHFTIDLRHPDDAVLARTRRRSSAIVAAKRGAVHGAGSSGHATCRRPTSIRR